MSAIWEIEASVAPVRATRDDGSRQFLVRVAILDADSSDPAPAAFIDLTPTDASRLALEILAAADDADWQTEQDGCWEAR